MHNETRPRRLLFIPPPTNLGEPKEFSNLLIVCCGKRHATGHCCNRQQTHIVALLLLLPLFFFCFCCFSLAYSMQILVQASFLFNRPANAHKKGLYLFPVFVLYLYIPFFFNDTTRGVRAEDSWEKKSIESEEGDWAYIEQRYPFIDPAAAAAAIPLS